jgi:hypothetical protein
MLQEIKNKLPRIGFKIRLPKPVRNALISALVLLVLFVGGGVAYTLVTGLNGDQNASAVAIPAALAPEPVIKPTQPSVNAKESAAVQMVTSPIAPGSNASLNVKTNSGSTCTISVIYNNIASTDSGLGNKTADDFGTVSWTWTVGSSVPLGTWPAKVTCAYHGRTAVVVANLQVTK